VNATYYCPHRPDEGCECRKPKPGLVLRAVEELGIDLADSIIAGDRQDRDGDLARNLGIPFIHFKR
ncbi:MAG: HAD-IIIA family hydrolase, partial [Candidatus Thermoplasmatota archaeon]|nr:HAD-IIIA family hydrolase [Candidatus Thermoplasmatota archaeon]